MSEAQFNAGQAPDTAAQLRLEQTKVAAITDRNQSLTDDLIALQQDVADMGSKLLDALDANDALQREAEVQRLRCEGLEHELEQTLIRAEAAEAALGALRSSRLVRFAGPPMRIYERILRITRRR